VAPWLRGLHSLLSRSPFHRFISALSPMTKIFVPRYLSYHLGGTSLSPVRSVSTSFSFHFWFLLFGPFSEQLSVYFDRRPLKKHLNIDGRGSLVLSEWGDLFFINSVCCFSFFDTKPVSLNFPLDRTSLAFSSDVYDHHHPPLRTPPQKSTLGWRDRNFSLFRLPFGAYATLYSARRPLPTFAFPSDKRRRRSLFSA